MEKEAVVVVIDPEFNTSLTSLGAAPKEFDSQEDVSVFDSNDDVSDTDTIKDNRNYNDGQHEQSRDDAAQKEEKKAYAYENAACQNVTDDDDDASDSGVSQATTQEAASASPSTPRLRERSVSILSDDAATTLPSTPTLTDRKEVADVARTLPCNAKLTDTEGNLVAMQSGEAKEFNCITLPVSCGQGA